VTQKIVKAAVAISKGRQDKLSLGSLAAEVDWSFAGDFVRAMHLVLQLDKGEDFVIASGIKRSIKDFVEQTFSYLDIDWRECVEEASGLVRAERQSVRVGNASKLKRLTGWRPEVDFEELVKMMIEAELRR
jgi:GDPmannose 4,6-dehydratase